MCEKYNGWSNYETWCINLWLTNTENIYNQVNQKAKEFYANAKKEGSYFTKKDYAVNNFAKWIEIKLDRDCPLQAASMYSDLLNHAMGMVDYWEIARAFMSEFED